MILAAAFRVHSRLGPGLLESAYERVLAYELTKGGLSVEVQKSIPIFYDELFFDDGYRADLIVEKRVLLELKSVETLLPVHAKQVLTYIQTFHPRLRSLHRDLRGHCARLLPMFSPVRIRRIGKDILPTFGQPGPMNYERGKSLARRTRWPRSS